MLALNNPTLMLIGVDRRVTLVLLALIWRALVLECVDPGFLRSVSRAGGAGAFRFPRRWS